LLLLLQPVDPPLGVLPFVALLHDVHRNAVSHCLRVVFAVELGGLGFHGQRVQLLILDFLFIHPFLEVLRFLLLRRVVVVGLPHMNMTPRPWRPRTGAVQPSADSLHIH